MLKTDHKKKTMKFILGMLGPINLADFREYLYPDSWHKDLPKGLGGTPVNLLSRELLNRGHHLIIFTLDPAVQDEIIVEGEKLRICIGPFRPRAKHRALDFFKVERQYLLQAIAREKPDILHAQWTYEYSLAAQKSGLPHIITAHDAPINVLRYDFTPYRIIRTLMAFCVLFKAKNVISVSPYVAKHLANFMFYRGEKEVVPNGMPEKQFKLSNLRQKSMNGITFVTILNDWSRLKNGKAAIKAFSLCQKKRPNDKLIMFGTGYGSGESAETWAKAYKIETGIEFAGHTPYQLIMERLGNETDILVHPALEEAHPMVLIEAMAAGIPIIGGQTSGGVPWTLDSGNAGILVDVTSAEAIAGAMSSLANNYSKRMSLRTKGRSFTKARFHIKIVTNMYEEIYKNILSV